MSPAAKQAHRRIAIAIGLFLAVHFAAHFAALFGIEAQDTVMQAGRKVYRIPVIEAALVLALAVQVVLGLSLLRTISRRRRKDRWHWVQFTSGCYLAYFIAMHTSAALLARFAAGLDTNFYWAAGTLVLSPLKYGFAPYYMLAIIALLSHVIAALHFRKPRKWHGPALIGGPPMGAALMLGYSGLLHAVDLPGAYWEYFAAYVTVWQ